METRRLRLPRTSFRNNISCIRSGPVSFFIPTTLRPNYCLSLDHDHPGNSRYIVAPDEDLGIDGSRVLPEFAIGSHRPGEEPAPLKTIYWFEDVLICLATSLDKEEIFEATIARMVEFGIKGARRKHVDSSQTHRLDRALSHLARRSSFNAP